MQYFSDCHIIILLDYDIQSVDDVTVNYDFIQDQTTLSFVSGAVDHADRVLINGRLEIDSFEQTTFNNQYTQNTIVDNATPTVALSNPSRNAT